MAPAFADHLNCNHVTAQRQVDGPMFDVNFGMRSAGFALGPRSGSWYELGPLVTVAPRPWFDLSARIGLAHVSYDGRQSESGITDTEARARIRLWRTQAGHGQTDFALWTGLGASLPSGSSEKGIGMGHVMLVPQVEMAATLRSRWALGLRVADVQMLGSHSAGAHAGHVHGAGTAHETAAASGSSVLMPHAPHELLLALGAGFGGERIRVGGGVTANLVLSDRSTLGAFGHGLSASGNAQVALTSALGLGVGVGVPVAGDNRYQWLGHASMYWRFGVTN